MLMSILPCLVKIIMKVAQTGVSSLESIQTPNFLKTARCLKKVQVGKDQEKAQSEKIPTPKTEVGKKTTNNQALIP